MRCGVTKTVTRVGNAVPDFDVKALATCLRGRSFMRPLSSRTHPM